jgi:uncharacterized protein (TIGR02145 family)
MKRLIFLPVALCTILSDCKEEKEKPLYFETSVPAAYTFQAAADSTTFTVAGNADWVVKVEENPDWCSVAPTSGKGDATVTVRIVANSVYKQGRTAEFVVTTGDYSKRVTITQAAPPCPDFSAGAIAATGQTVTIGGTPATIGSAKPATGGDGKIAYQWYKNGAAISGATGATYTPPEEDAEAVAVNTYTRHAKDSVCNATLTPATGSWALSVVCPSFNPGAIATTGQSMAIGGTPTAISSVQNATSTGTISYQWYKNGAAISGATNATYTPPAADAAAAGVITYTRRAKDNICNTTLSPSTGSWVLTVTCLSLNPGAIAATGQSLIVGRAPAIISSVQNATGNGTISYQWYKNGTAISGATNATYTPPAADAAAAGVITYTRRAKDNICNTTLSPSTGNWVLTVTCPSLNPGAIATDGQTIFVRGTPTAISSVQDATGDATISYQWYKNGTAISGATDASYTPSYGDASTKGVHTYTRSVRDNACNTTVTSTGSWVLTVIDCHLPENTTAIAFTNFSPCSSSYGATWQLTDERDEKTYKVRYLPDGRYWMVQDLRYGGSEWDACVDKTSFDGGSLAYTHRFGPYTYGDCTNARDENTPADRGYLYDWIAATQYVPSGSDYSSKHGICPYLFHIPTKDEYSDANIQFTSYYRCDYDGDVSACWFSTDKWDPVFSGYSMDGTLYEQGYRVSYWSGYYYPYPYDYSSSYFYYYLSFYKDSGSVVGGGGYPGFGFPIRCVRY